MLARSISIVTYTDFEETAMKHHPYPTMLTMIGITLLAACASTPSYSPPAWQAEVIDTEAFAPKVDAFAVVLDASSSMKDEYQGRSKFDLARDTVSNMNQTIPPMDYRAALVAFGTGRCTGGRDAEVLYGLAPYQQDDFSAGLSKLTCASGTTPMAEGLETSAELLSSESGEIAVILVSDFWSIDTKPVIKKLTELSNSHGNKLCIHTVKVGDSVKGDAVIAAIGAISSCGSAVSADSIGSASAMAGYVKNVLLSPVEYQKHSFSAEVLFDFDKSILKPGGKAALHELDESIKARGSRVTDINVVGHTDSIGSEKYNQGLSERRAHSVTAYMTSDGVNGSIIDATGEGESNPVASNATAEGRAQNRRVDIHVGGAQAMMH